MESPIQVEFENKLLVLGLVYSINDENFYTISNQSGGGSHIEVQLVPSLPIINQVHGSKNGNVVEGIGIFKLKLLVSRPVPDILAFAFQNTLKNQSEYIVIPREELIRRLFKMNPGYVRRKTVRMVFWLMHDGFVYNTKNISIEAEWYFLSKGLNGRMADETVMDYTTFRNKWGLLNL